MLLGLLTFCQPRPRLGMEMVLETGERNSGLTWGRGTNSTSTSQVSLGSRADCSVPFLWLV